jgi:VWFA-related protein
MRTLLALLLVGVLPVSAQQPEPDGSVTFSVTSNLVVVNVGAKDRNGRPLEDLKAEDFEVIEEGKKQEISVFEFQRLDGAALLAAAQADPIETDRTEADLRVAEAGEKPKREREITPSTPGQVRYQDRRLLVLYFDLSSMPPTDQIRARKAAETFLAEQMTAADLVAVMAFSSRLQVLQDFTDNRELLREVIASFRIGEASELALDADTDEDSAIDDGAAFVADETEFNIFNTDQKLSALESATKMLGSLPEKKALVYFASGVSRTGVENNSQLRSTVNAAVRANVSFYPIDTRGLVAEAPLGDATVGSQRGTRAFSGQGQRQRRERFNDSQDTLVTLAEDTGGRVFLNDNNLTMGIKRAQQEISSYYILGYYSTNTTGDGRYRRVKIRLRSNPKAKLDYRSGYFGPKDFRRFSQADKERQLEEALLLGDPITDLRLALEVNYFRLGRDQYFVPVAVKVPGSELELARKGGREQTRLDFIGQVRNQRGRLVASLRDHIEVKLQGEKAEGLSSHNLQYDSGFTLPPGDYTLKFLTRENETGKMGTFETNFAIPDLGEEKAYSRVSSVVWSNQREALDEAVGAAERRKKVLATHPLVHDGQKLIPSITRVFRKEQAMYVYLEVYDAGSGGRAEQASISAGVTLYRDGVKMFESERLRVSETGEAKRKAAPVEFQIPLDELAAGKYVCQVSVIDEIARKFAFRRAPIVLLP